MHKNTKNMKRIFFLALFVVMSITTFAQEDYHPLVTNGKYWKGKEIGGNPILQNNDDTPGLQFEYDVFLQGDTVINGVSYLKCYKIEERGTNGNSPSYYRALREEGRKVYGLSNGSEEERLMFDFNMQEGDVVYCKWEGGHESFLIEGDMNESQEQVIRTMKLERIDMYTNTEGLALRRYHFTTNVKEKMDDGSIMEYESLPTVWVEGIGSQNDYPLNSWHVDLVSSY